MNVRFGILFPFGIGWGRKELEFLPKPIQTKANCLLLRGGGRGGGGEEGEILFLKFFLELLLEENIPEHRSLRPRITFNLQSLICYWLFSHTETVSTRLLFFSDLFFLDAGHLSDIELSCNLS